MLHQNEEKSKQEKEGKQRFMGAMKTLGIAALLWQHPKGKQEVRQRKGRQQTQRV